MRLNFFFGYRFNCYSELIHVLKRISRMKKLIFVFVTGIIFYMNIIITVFFTISQFHLESPPILLPHPVNLGALWGQQFDGSNSPLMMHRHIYDDYRTQVKFEFNLILIYIHHSKKHFMKNSILI